MYASPMRLSRVWHLGVVLAVVAIVGGAAMVVLGLSRLAQPEWVGLVAAGGAIAFAAAFCLIILRIALKMESNTARAYGEAREISEALAKASRILSAISDNTSLSDAAKSIAHRSQEREALRTAIDAEVRNGDFEAVLHLIDELETRLGLTEEAERFRNETRAAAAEAFRNKLKEALAHVDGLLDAHAWDRAEREINRLQKLMPDEKRVAELWDLRDEKRQLHKQSLWRAWDEATRSSDIERGIALLKELDPYLTREEARSLENSARGLLKERLLQLGVQFQFAVKERRWRDALSTGLQIAEEFPNSRMAREVRDRMEALRARAGLDVDVEVTARVAETTGGQMPNP